MSSIDQNYDNPVYENPDPEVQRHTYSGKASKEDHEGRDITYSNSKVPLVFKLLLLLVAIIAIVALVFALIVYTRRVSPSTKRNQGKMGGINYLQVLIIVTDYITTYLIYF